MSRRNNKTPFTVTVTTIYALSMAKTIYFQLRGVENVRVVKGDTVEQAGPTWTVKLGSNVVATFKVEDTQGWWFVEEK